ncbi:TrmB family transcriptional regulator [Halosimplex sp. J119]
MDDLANQDRAVELLQQLGLKEYEAKSFVALSRLPAGTAKDISDVSEVPRTRVYDAARVLETKGLVEVQHSNPQRFRAVSVDEAVMILQNEYEDRTESLRETLQDLDQAVGTEETEVTHDVWALTGDTAITSRTQQLIDEADEEIILVIGHESVFTEELAERLEAAQQRGLSVIIGTVTETLRERIQDALPDTEVFVSELSWLSQSTLADDTTEISRLLLVDREAILVSTYHETNRGGQEHEQAVFGRGFHNGIVAITRRMLATGLIASVDPRAEDQ